MRVKNVQNVNQVISEQLPGNAMRNIQKFDLGKRLQRSKSI